MLTIIVTSIRLVLILFQFCSGWAESLGPEPGTVDSTLPKWIIVEVYHFTGPYDLRVKLSADGTFELIEFCRQGISRVGTSKVRIEEAAELLQLAASVPEITDTSNIGYEGDFYSMVIGTDRGIIKLSFIEPLAPKEMIVLLDNLASLRELTDLLETKTYYVQAQSVDSARARTIWDSRTKIYKLNDFDSCSVKILTQGLDDLYNLHTLSKEQYDYLLKRTSSLEFFFTTDSLHLWQLRLWQPVESCRP